MTEFSTEFNFVAERIKQAQYPEQVFGELTGVKDPFKHGLRTYHYLAKLTHPDLYSDLTAKTLAQAVFIRLTELWEITQEKLKNGTYGEMPIDTINEEVTIINGVREYSISTKFYETDLFSYFPCTYLEDGTKFNAVFKVNPDPIDNDRLIHEAEVLKTLSQARGFERFHKYFPKLIDSFRFINAEDSVSRQVNILLAEPGIYSLKEVREAYPAGIDPKDMAWIFRRLLVGLGFAHNFQILHGAILPQNIFIHPQRHGLVIAEWSNALMDMNLTEGRLAPILPKLADWYPPEMADKESITKSADIYMGIRCMIYLLGGEPIGLTLPDPTPKKLQDFFCNCTASNPKRRPQDAWGLLEEFNQLIEQLWGPRTFRPFTMPKRVYLNAFW